MNKPNKVNYSNYTKISDKFWRDNMMKVLKCWYYEQFTWDIDNWHKYGISEADKKKIIKEFERQVENNEKN